jgi:hypothetical protein
MPSSDFFFWFGDVFSSWMFFHLHQATWPGNHLDDDQGAHDVVEEAGPRLLHPLTVRSNLSSIGEA